MPVRAHADDLGLHPAIDRAIFRAFEAGAIAGASILATGPTFAAAAAEARALGLPISLHLAIVDTEPLSPPSEVPSLVARDGRFPPMFGVVARRALLGQLQPGDLHREIGRQLEAVAEAGLIGAGGLTVDGHQHLHLLPPVFSVILDYAEPYRISAFRLPLRSPAEHRQRSIRALGFAAVEWLGRRGASRASRLGLRAIPCWGVLHAGHLTLDRARAVLGSLGPGADGQLISHPGDDDRALAQTRNWGYAWETELATILALNTRLHA